MYGDSFKKYSINIGEEKMIWNPDAETADKKEMKAAAD